MVLMDVHGQVDIDRFIILYSQSDIHKDAVNWGAGRRAGVQSGHGVGPWPLPELSRLDSCTAGGEEAAPRRTGGPPSSRELRGGPGLAAKLGGWDALRRALRMLPPRPHRQLRLVGLKVILRGRQGLFEARRGH